MRRESRPFAWMVCWAILGCLLTISSLARADDDALTRARKLAYSGKAQRAECLSVLRQHLEQEPEDSEARVLYGIVLSWEGKYDDSREQLSQVLARYPSHADALPALINVELWSDHPDRAGQLAQQGLATDPDNLTLLLDKARALRNAGRMREARKVLGRVVALDPNNADALQMRRSIDFDLRWEGSVTQTQDWFSDGRDRQQEISFSLRAPVRFGSVVGTVNRADRFSLASYQTELDFYPHFRPGTYANFNVGYSADGNLYPTYRLGGDLYQSIGRGFEISGGYRHLAFSTGVNIYTFALARYYRSWLFTTRGFVTPGTAGPSGTALFSARHFFGWEGQHNYVEFRYSRGASPAFAETVQDIEVLHSSRFAVAFDKALGGRWSAAFTGGIGQEQRIGLKDLKRYTLQGSISYRF